MINLAYLASDIKVNSYKYNKGSGRKLFLIMKGDELEGLTEFPEVATKLLKDTSADALLICEVVELYLREGLEDEAYYECFGFDNDGDTGKKH